MQEFFPILLTRQKAMQMLDCNRTELEKLVLSGEVRTFKTAGGHNRYFRNDLTKEQLFQHTKTLIKKHNG